MPTLLDPLSSPSPPTQPKKLHPQVIVRTEKPQYKPRTYPEGPLPLTLSTNAPRKARIVGREITSTGALYHIRVGEVDVRDVGLYEILEYVSAKHLEDYETQQAAEEEIAIRAAEEAHEARVAERRALAKERVKSKGAVFFEEVSGDEAGLVREDGVGDGTRGRERPTYAHMFKPVGGRRRRRRDAETGELLPLSAGEESDQMEDVVEDQPKRRRRRKRDPVTGELLPLDKTVEGAVQEAVMLSANDDDEDLHAPILAQEDSSGDEATTTAMKLEGRVSEQPKTKTVQPRGNEEPKKRRRRKRDPVTGELLPLQSKPSNSKQQHKPIGTLFATTHALPKPQPTPLPPTTRPLASTSQARANPQRSPQRIPAPPPSAHIDHRKLPRRRRHPLTGVMMPLGWKYKPNAPEERKPNARAGEANVVPMSPAFNRMSITDEPATKRAKVERTEEPAEEEYSSDSSMEMLAVSESGSEAEDEMVVPSVSLVAPVPSIAGTSIPAARARATPTTATKVPSARPPGLSSADAASSRQSSLPSSASQSSPAPPPPPTTMTSHLPKRNPLQARHGRSLTSADEESADDSEEGAPPIASTIAVKAVPTQANHDGDDEEDDGPYEVELIKSHQLSDPRTHPVDLGKKPVMLYQVKWKGWVGHTWEPLSSFDDVEVVRRYRRRVGLGKIVQEGGSNR